MDFHRKVVILRDTFVNFLEKDMISPHTFEIFTFGGSGIDTPIEDQKWSGSFVKRIRGSDHGSWIGVVDFL